MAGSWVRSRGCALRYRSGCVGAGERNSRGRRSYLYFRSSGRRPLHRISPKPGAILKSDEKPNAAEIGHPMKILSRVCALLLIPASVSAQRPAIYAEDARTFGSPGVKVGLGAEYLRKGEVPLPVMSISELRLAVIAARFGVAKNVDFDLEWRGRLIARTDQRVHQSDWGDLTIATKINLIGEQEILPAIGIRSAVKLPNTRYLPYRLGSNQTDYFFHILFTRSLSQIELRGNIGFGIVGDPRGMTSQDDIIYGGCAVIISVLKTTRVFLELHGFTGPWEGDDKFVTRFGFLGEIFGLQWNMFGSARIAGNVLDFGTAFEESESWSAGIFVTKQIEF